jgi:hypothetical protein
VCAFVFASLSKDKYNETWSRRYTTLRSALLKITHQEGGARLVTQMNCVGWAAILALAKQDRQGKSRKRSWLQDRLMTERLRQYHFQTLVLRLPEILQSLKYEAAKTAFGTQRDLRFGDFKTRFVGKLDSELTRAISEEHESDVWLHSARHDTGDFGQSDRLDPLFKAYRELRIEQQLGYVNHKLRDDQNLFSNAPRSQAALFSNVGFLCIAMLCAIHLFSISVIVLNPSEWQKISWVISILSIILALVALAIRAVEQGLQPEREVERYQQYRSALRAILERFDFASSTTEKVATMRELERYALTKCATS